MSASSVDTAGLLPRSGIGVDGPFLVIAPPGNPAISLDARLLDRIELIRRSPTSAFAMGTLAVGGVVAGALSLIPGGPIVAAGMAYLAHDRFSEGRKRNNSRDLLLALGSLEVALHVEDGAAEAKRIADTLTQYSRHAPITRAEVYQDAKRRMRAQASANSNLQGDSAMGLRVGDETVLVSSGYLRVGSTSFRSSEVREYALRGANLPLPGGRLLQAALALLVIVADERARKGEDLDALAKRIAEYEEWTGRNANR
ncbi:MAG: hypothetical protein JKY56_27070 [Kofleriaceae bacterium]|nr:hypothetical protein [Kofleriaceae bacterium]